MGDIAIKLIYNVGIMFIMMIPGIILKRSKFIPDGFGKEISATVMIQPPKKMTLPASLTTIGANAFAGAAAEEFILPEGITSIEIYYFAEGVYDIDPELHTPVAVLEESQHADILKDIEDMRFTTFQMLVPIPTDPPYDLRGYVVRLNYELGDYEDISNGVQKFRQWRLGEWKHGDKFLDCDEEEWKDMIQKYLPVEKPLPTPQE